MDERLDTKKRKRSKYVTKACVECKRRKIKCNGQYPCQHCQSVAVPCKYVEGRARGGARRAGVRMSTATATSGSCSDDLPGEDLVEKVRVLEERLELVCQHISSQENTGERRPNSLRSSLPADSQCSSPSYPSRPSNVREQRGEHEPHPYKRLAEQTVQSTNTRIHSTSPTEMKGAHERAFYGQSSSVDNLTNLRNQLTNFAAVQSPAAADNQASPAWQEERILDSRSISLSITNLPSGEETMAILETYFDEMNVLYPMIHTPTFFHRYSPLWSARIEDRLMIVQQNRYTKSELGLLFACLAASASITHTTAFAELRGKSREWYLTAKELSLDRKIEEAADLESIQTFIMLSLYFVHIENEDASYKILGTAIRAAHELGLNIGKREMNLSGAHIELRRRAWWCLYLLDRRTAICLGRPCGIQDHNMDVAYPTVLDDLHAFPQQFAVPVVMEHSKIPYLVQYVKYGEICGEIYDKVYSTKSWPPDEQVVLSLDAKLEQWRFAIPSFLRFDQSRLDSIPSWLGKQQLFLYLRGANLRLLLLQPFLSNSQLVASSHHRLAESALSLSSEIIHTIALAQRVGTLVNKLWYPSKQILLTCIGSIFWIVLNFPNKFAANSSKVDLRVALRLLKEFSGKSVNPESLRSLRDVQFLRYLSDQANRSRNDEVARESPRQAKLSSALNPALASLPTSTTRPRPAASTTTTTTTAAAAANANLTNHVDNAIRLEASSYPLLSVHAKRNDSLDFSQILNDDLLLDLLDFGDSNYLPTSEEYMKMGEDSSWQTMLQF